MAKRSSGGFGHWAFLIGVVLAVIAGLVPQLGTPAVTWILVVLGLIVGLLNITGHETQEFLIATVALIIAASVAANMVQLGMVISKVLGNIVAFVSPAALLVALKAIWELARD
ncbi:hypothetical protein COV18_00055 [Candidatus Woesearchaeota archaeon CG10_big_fil_rev_8_21_14_0_10_37_12]|nr:MAG: hypothetical protein COV18_00055 [Candidatus Woesearchaeota archaeon CG10_big_fil_rev_8_21_14_0_10_37_12]